MSTSTFIFSQTPYCPWNEHTFSSLNVNICYHAIPDTWTRETKKKRRCVRKATPLFTRLLENMLCSIRQNSDFDIQLMAALNIHHEYIMLIEFKSEAHSVYTSMHAKWPILFRPHTHCAWWVANATSPKYVDEFQLEDWQEFLSENTKPWIFHSQSARDDQHCKFVFTIIIYNVWTANC